MIKRWKIEAIVAKCCRDRRGISLSSGEEENNKDETKDDTDSD